MSLESLQRQPATDSVRFVIAICCACLRGFVSIANGDRIACPACGELVRRLAVPLDVAAFEELSVTERNDLKLAGKERVHA